MPCILITKNWFKQVVLVLWLIGVYGFPFCYLTLTLLFFPEWKGEESIRCQPRQNMLERWRMVLSMEKECCIFRMEANTREHGKREYQSRCAVYFQRVFDWDLTRRSIVRLKYHPIAFHKPQSLLSCAPQMCVIQPGKTFLFSHSLQNSSVHASQNNNQLLFWL